MQVVHTYRFDGKVKQQLLREIGSTYDEETREQLRAEGEMYSQIGWDQVLTASRWSSNRILKDLVLARLEKPPRKRQTVVEYEPLTGPELQLS